MGGTFGSSHRMIDRLSKDVKLDETKNEPFDQFVGMNGRIQFLIHPIRRTRFFTRCWWSGMV